MSDVVPKSLFDEEREKVERLNREIGDLRNQFVSNHLIICFCMLDFCLGVL